MIKEFKYCPIIEIGDVFTRIDRNGKVWEAKVINRTEYFVDVEKSQPYQVKCGDKFGWHYEDAPITTERCELHQYHTEVECGESEKVGLFGTYISKDYKKVPTNKYWIDCKEDYSAHSKYDRTYELIKRPSNYYNNVDEALNKFDNYVKTGEYND